MRILSLFYGHDANCTLMEDGEPVVVVEKERRTRVKHDKGVYGHRSDFRGVRLESRNH